MTLLKVTNIQKTDNTGFALQNVSFSQRKFQKIAIAGETGSGKSTLLKIIAGLEQADNGEVLLEGERVKGPAEQLVPGNSRILYLSQHFELPHSLRVEQVLEYANTISDEHAGSLFQTNRIDHLAKRRTNELSGGERQRIALTRLLISSPVLLLLDEPFSNLDLAQKTLLKRTVAEILQRMKMSCILVSHDPVDTLPWADKIIVMRNGKIEQQGTPEKIYRNPINEYVAGLFGAYTKLSPSEDTSLLKELKISTKEIILRPEDFVTQPKKERGVTGTVEKISFFGSHYDLSVRISNKLIIVRNESAIDIGDKVSVALRKKSKIK